MTKAGWMALMVSVLVLAACNGMEMQPKYKALDPSTFYENGMSARPQIANTVARGQVDADPLMFEGEQNGQAATEFPFAVTDEVLKKGQVAYNAFCTPCHGYSGYGDGIVVQRGFSPPPSFHSDRLRNAPVGYFFNVITNGFGAMYSYGDRVPPEYRWAIIAYIRALQLSQDATIEDVPPEMQPTLEAQTEVVTETTTEDESEE